MLVQRDKRYWLAMCHPFEVFSALERAVRWMTFGLYKPFIVATLCGLLEEWKESREHALRNEGRRR